MSEIELPSWDVDEFRKEMDASLNGSDRLKLLTPSLNSLQIRYKYARYHYECIKDLIEIYEKDFGSISDSVQRNLRLIVRNQSVTPFEISIGAHVFGCLQSMHAVTDMLSIVIHHSLAFDKPNGFIDERSVKAGLSAIDRTDQKYHRLKCLFENMIGDKNYKYLHTLTNLAKHERLVAPQFSSDSATLQFPEFESEGQQFKKCEVRKFLANTYDKNEIKLIEIGKELTILVKSNLNIE